MQPKVLGDNPVSYLFTRRSLGATGSSIFDSKPLATAFSHAFESTHSKTHFHSVAPNRVACSNLICSTTGLMSGLSNLGSGASDGPYFHIKRSKASPFLLRTFCLCCTVFEIHACLEAVLYFWNRSHAFIFGFFRIYLIAS